MYAGIGDGTPDVADGAVGAEAGLGAALLCWVADAFRQSCSYGPLARGGGWLALGAALAGWLLAGSGSCTGGVATGGLWELLWRGGYWLALEAALAGVITLGVPFVSCGFGMPSQS